MRRFWQKKTWEKRHLWIPALFLGAVTIVDIYHKNVKGTMLIDSVFPVYDYVNHLDEPQSKIYQDEDDRTVNAGEVTASGIYVASDELMQITAENQAGQGDEDGELQGTLNITGNVYDIEMLKNPRFLLDSFYLVDSGTEVVDGLLDGADFVSEDFSIDESLQGPKVLVYHTHSQETFADSRPDVVADSVVGLGETLCECLETKYGISTLHLEDTFDIINGEIDRSEAYTMAERKVRQVLEEYPSIQVVIDLHRDGVPEGTTLLTMVDQKETAQIMFLNGLCRTSVSGPITYLENPYLSDNLAFSLQLKLAAEKYYPGFSRKIFLCPYQYNLHLMQRCLLIECGAQNNTVAQVQNAMEPLADILYDVLR